MVIIVVTNDTRLTGQDAKLTWLSVLSSKGILLKKAISLL